MISDLQCLTVCKVKNWLLMLITCNYLLGWMAVRTLNEESFFFSSSFFSAFFSLFEVPCSSANCLSNEANAKLINCAQNGMENWEFNCSFAWIWLSKRQPFARE